MPYTSKGTVFVYDATLGNGSRGDYVNICKERFDRGAAATVCRLLGYVDADIAEPGYDDTPPEYFTDAFTLGYEKSFTLSYPCSVAAVHKSVVICLL